VQNRAIEKFNKNKKMAKIIYLDNAATTKVDSRVTKKMLPYFSEKYGNASSQHFLGKQARGAVENAREIIAKSINASPEEIYFTSGGTESNNWALKELFFANKTSGKNHIITTKIEHDSILNVCEMLEKLGAKLTYLNVDREGFIDLNELKKSITNETLAVSVIHGNNEIGTIQNISEIGKICKEKGIYFHIDACQSFIKKEIDVVKDNLDLVTLNSHKIHGPKGIGALFIKKNTKIGIFMHGGGHEGGMRSGTENVPAIVGFGEAVRVSNYKDTENMEKLRDYCIRKILNEISNTELNGSRQERLCNNINISFKNIEGEAIAMQLEEYGIIVSTGSACASHNLKKSHVLKEIGLNDMEINSSIRISLSRYTTKEDAEIFIDKLKIAVAKLRKISPFKN
jgi:cysteine desulfurase